MAFTTTVGGAISGIFGDRQRAKRDGADQRQDDRDDAGEDRPIDEEVRKSHCKLPHCRLRDESPRAEPRYCAAAFDLAVLGLDLLSRTGALQTLDDDAVGRREARADDAQAVDDRAELDPLGADRAVVGDREDDLARLIGRDRAVGHEQRVVLAAEQPQPPEVARASAGHPCCRRWRGRGWCRSSD